jgi:hypothetical protein
MRSGGRNGSLSLESLSPVFERRLFFQSGLQVALLGCSEPALKVYARDRSLYGFGQVTEIAGRRGGIRSFLDTYLDIYVSSFEFLRSDWSGRRTD